MYIEYRWTTDKIGNEPYWYNKFKVLINKMFMHVKTYDNTVLIYSSLVRLTVINYVNI